MSTATVAITIRLPAEMHAELVRLAQSQHRSLNGQILHQLALSLTPPSAGTA